MSGEISTRQLRVMIEHLPPDNAVTREVNATPWDETQYMLWDISASLRILNTGLYNMTRESGKPAIEPQFLGKPEDTTDMDEPKTPNRLTPKQVAERAFMDEILKRKIPKR